MDNLKDIEFSSFFWAFLIPIAFMVSDIVTGFLCAWVKKKISSKVMRTGLAKKLGEAVVLGLINLVCVGTNVPIAVFYFTAVYISFMEAISILENLTKLGVKLPNFVKKMFKNAEQSVNKSKEGD